MSKSSKPMKRVSVIDGDNVGVDDASPVYYECTAFKKSRKQNLYDAYIRPGIYDFVNAFGGVKLSTWVERKFVVRKDQCLYYYEGEKCAGKINLIGARCGVPGTDDHRDWDGDPETVQHLDFEDSEHGMSLACRTGDEMSTLCEAINDASRNFVREFDDQVALPFPMPAR